MAMQTWPVVGKVLKEITDILPQRVCVPLPQILGSTFVIFWTTLWWFSCDYLQQSAAFWKYIHLTLILEYVLLNSTHFIVEVTTLDTWVPARGIAWTTVTEFGHPQATDILCYKAQWAQCVQCVDLEVLLDLPAFFTIVYASYVWWELQSKTYRAPLL